LKFLHSISDLIEKNDKKVRYDYEIKFKAVKKEVRDLKAEYYATLDLMGESPLGRKNAMVAQIEVLDDKILKQTSIIKDVM
jgi:hypothetical protein